MLISFLNFLQLLLETWIEVNFFPRINKHKYFYGMAVAKFWAKSSLSKIPKYPYKAFADFCCHSPFLALRAPIALDLAQNLIILKSMHSSPISILQHSLFKIRFKIKIKPSHWDICVISMANMNIKGSSGLVKVLCLRSSETWLEIINLLTELF